MTFIDKLCSSVKNSCKKINCYLMDFLLLMWKPLLHTIKYYVHVHAVFLSERKLKPAWTVCQWSVYVLKRLHRVFWLCKICSCVIHSKGHMLKYQSWQSSILWHDILGLKIENFWVRLIMFPSVEFPKILVWAFT